jgi:hypothetical protein
MLFFLSQVFLISATISAVFISNSHSQLKTVSNYKHFFKMIFLIEETIFLGLFTLTFSVFFAIGTYHSLISLQFMTGKVIRYCCFFSSSMRMCIIYARFSADS